MFDPTKAANLSAAHYTNGWTLWHYRCRDATIADVFAPGYWDGFGGQGRDGDTIIIDHPGSQSQVTCRFCRDGETLTLKVQQSF